MPDPVLNEQGNRAVVGELFGIACYEGAITDGVFSGRHAGVVKDEGDAAEFLRGGTPASLIRIYDGGDRPFQM